MSENFIVLFLSRFRAFSTFYLHVEIIQTTGREYYFNCLYVRSLTTIIGEKIVNCCKWDSRTCKFRLAVHRGHFFSRRCFFFLLFPSFNDSSYRIIINRNISQYADYYRSRDIFDVLLAFTFFSSWNRSHFGRIFTESLVVTSALHAICTLAFAVLITYEIREREAKLPLQTLVCQCLN